MKLHVIHDPAQTERRHDLDEQLRDIDHEYWPAVFADTFATGCAQAHMGVVRHLQAAAAPYGLIAEDDLRWTGAGAWQRFLAGLAALPAGWDIYLGGISWHGTMGPAGPIGQEPTSAHFRTVQRFTGLHLYALNERCYSRVLVCPTGQHLDAWLGRQDIRAYVCWPMVAVQAPGWSANRQQVMDYTSAFGAYELWGGSGAQSADRDG